MTVFSYSQLEQLWLNAGGSPSLEATMAAIAEAESSGNSNATGADQEEGLWQIDPHYWPAQYVTYDPAGNARGAVHVEATQGLSAWSTYNSGAYKQFLSGAAPSGAGSVPANATGTSTTGIHIPGTNITIPTPGDVTHLLDPNTWIQDIGQTILKSLGLPTFKDLFQRLGLILLGAVIMFIGIQMLTRNAEFKLTQPPSSPTPATANEASPAEKLSPAEEESAATTGAGAAGTGALSSEALEAAAVALWLAHLSTLSALAWYRGGLTWASITAVLDHFTR